MAVAICVCSDEYNLALRSDINRTSGFGPVERTRQVLNYVHALLAHGKDEEAESLLRGLVRVFQADTAGLAGPFPGEPFLEYRIGGEDRQNGSGWSPWLEHPDLIAPPTSVPLGKVFQARGDARALIITLSHPTGNWLLWMETRANQAWLPGERSAFVMASMVLLPLLLSGATVRIGDVAVDQGHIQQRMHDAGRLAGRLAHDFDNVLTGILGFSELAMQQLSSKAAARPLLQELLQAAERGTEFTHRLRTFSHAGSASSRPTSLAEILAAEEHTLVKGLPPGVIWTHNVPADLPTVALDALPLRLILRHLVGNAIEAVGRAGTVVVDASSCLLTATECLNLLGSARPGPYVRLAVADTGSGLAAEAQHRILSEPFFTSKPGHLGLGLPTVYRTLQAHGGGLRLDSQRPHGTLVQVFMPVHQGLPATT